MREHEERKIFPKSVDKHDLKCYNKTIKKERARKYEKEDLKMTTKTCGNCKFCVENNICNGDCLCKAKAIEVSADDDIRFYGEQNGSACESFTAKS